MLPELATLREDLERLLGLPERLHGIKRAARQLARELHLHEAWTDSHEWTHQRAKGLQGLALQIGGGQHRIDGYFNLDLVPPADFVWDAREGLPFVDASVAAIFTEHFLEHIDYPVSVRAVLAECQRVLCPGGTLRIGVPDAGAIARAYASGDAHFLEELRMRWYGRRGDAVRITTAFDVVNYVFRDEDDSARYTPHLWAYDAENLRALLAEAGFSRIRPWEPDLALVNPKRIYASLYLEATK